ncbi:MAG: membrane protein insertase YidC, partial [Myxococcota bacterium]
SVPTVEEPETPERVIHLESPLVKLGVSTRGGRVVEASLPKFTDTREKKGKDAPPVDLVGGRPDALGALRLTLEGHAATASYHVKEEGPARVVLERESGGVRVTRTLELDPEGYGVKTWTELTNTADAPRTVNPQLAFAAHVRAEEKEQGGFLSGGAPLDQTTFLCQTPDELWREAAVHLKEPRDLKGKVAWAGLDRQYFLTGTVVREGEVVGCHGSLDAETARLNLQYAALTLPPGGTVKLGADSYFGPKQQAWLTRVDPRLTDAIDYGWFGVIVRLLLVLLLWFYSLIPNYGVAIFMLTLTVKLITLPLTQKSFISMQRMKDLAPRVKEIQTRWAHDKATQGQKMMELYKEENVSPLGGCLPMLIQMPVWIALYRTLYTSVELYQQPFIPGWIDDLAQKDPFYVTPLALGVVMLVQALLTPQPEDNPQMKYMSYGMPVFFTFIMLALPAGLTLYMFFNTVLTIVQQLYIKRRFGTPPAAGKAPRSPAPPVGASGRG